VALTSDQFRGYADHMASAEFSQGMDELLEVSSRLRTTLMCAEALWWRCHRRLIADLWVDRGGNVVHIYSDGKLEPHSLWDLARREGDGLVYPPEQGELGLSPPPRTR